MGRNQVTRRILWAPSLAVVWPSRYDNCFFIRACHRPDGASAWLVQRYTEGAFLTVDFPTGRLADRSTRAARLPPPLRWGAIERAHGSWVEGWTRNPAKPAESVRVICLLDGEVAGFAIAEHVRPELSGPGQVVGARGFRCHVPARKLHRASVITCLADSEAGLTLIHERLLPRPPAAAPTQRPAIHFDISDLLEFLLFHREVSGIQRVQCGYLRHALGVTDRDFVVRVCARVPELCRYVEISNECAAAILLGIETQRMLPMADWRDFIGTQRLGSGRAPAFAPGDIILTTGAPWTYDDYFMAITAIKAEHGVRYFQILHDLVPILLPEVTSSDSIPGFTKSMAGALDCADHVLANSRHSESDLRHACAQLGLACPPISVIPLGGTLDDGQAPAPMPRSRFSPRERYGEFVLCVGTIEPRKNHQYLYYVWKRLLARFGTRTPKLICIGRIGWHVEELQRLLKVSANLEGYFIHLTDIGDTDLLRFYRDCLFTVFPSLYEGWGLPVAESLLYGKICVTSHAASMPEVGGDWVPYIDPHNIENGVEVLSGLLTDRARLEAMETRLRDGYRPLTWEAATGGLLDAIATAASLLPLHDPQPQGTAIAHCLPVLALGHTYSPTPAPADRPPLATLRAAFDVRSVERLLIGADWHQLEDWGCWSCGLVARIGFGLPNNAPSRLLCYLCFRLPGFAGTSHCEILVDGVLSQRIEVTGGKDYDVRLDLVVNPAGMHERRDVMLDLRIDELVEPVRDAGDQRLLGIGLRSLCVCAADDVRQRLAYLEQRFQILPAGGADDVGSKHSRV